MESVREQLVEIDNDLQSCTIQSDDFEYTQATLLDMPVEIILQICSYLQPVFLKHTFRCVCKRLESILSDEGLWKNWVHSRVKGHYPPIQKLKIWDEKPIDWENVCVEMDFEFQRWSNVKETMKHVIVKDMHCASVDTVLLVNNGQICVTGSRDRCMALLNMPDIISTAGHADTDPVTYDNKPLKMLTDAHRGWVWDLAPDHPESTTSVYSASWDNSVKVWDLETFECVEKFTCGMPVLTLVGNGKEVMAGLYGKKVHIFDQRSGINPIHSYNAHKGAVLDLCKYNNLIASISDDKTITIYDRVAGKVLKHAVQVPNNDNRAYPVCISWSEAAMYVGDSKGYLYLFDPEEHVHTSSIEMWEQPSNLLPQIKTKCCYQSDGIMIVCSDKGGIKFLYSSYPPTEFTSIVSSTIDITQLRYQNGILAISTSDSALELWIPTEQCDSGSL